MTRRLALFTLFTLALLSAARTACAQDIQEGFEMTIPQLGGHVFVPNSIVTGPFLNSSFTSTIGLEQTVNLTIPPPDILPDSIKGLEGNLLFVGVEFTYRQRIKDWIAFYLNIGIAVRSGTELRSLLTEGLNTLTGGETGVKFNLMETTKHKLTGGVSISNYDVTLVNLRQWVDDLINGVPNATITQDVPTFAAGVNLYYAFGITEVTGLMATAQLHYGESIVRGEQNFRARLGTSLDLNWASKGFPLGLSFAYLLRSTPDYVYVDDKYAHTVNLKLAYTGSPDFAVGLEIYGSSVPTLVLAKDVTTAGAAVSMHYFFN